MTDVDKRMKRSIICMAKIAGDHTCMARALVVAVTKLRNPKDRSVTQGPHNNLLWRRAVDLLEQVGLSPERDVYFHEIEKFEKHLNIQVIIYDKPFSGSVVYLGKVERMDKVFLYYSDNHCDVITSITGFLSRTHYCVTCFKPYSDIKKHSCRNCCRVCESNKCPVSTQTLVCRLCFTECRSPECFTRHLLDSATGKEAPCAKYVTCKICTRLCPRSEIDEHMCASRRCPMCEQQVVGVHRCYMRAVKPVKTSGKFLYYDFECTQNTVLTCSAGYRPAAVEGCTLCTQIGTLCSPCSLCVNCNKSMCGMGRHVPNLVVCQSVCDTCVGVALENAESSCDSCGSRCELCSSRDSKGGFKGKPCDVTCGMREVVFKGENTATDFAEWLFTPAHKGFKVFAHNAKGYDNVFLLRHLISLTHSKVRTIYSGSKITCLTVPEYNIQLLDSMSFFPMSLKNLAKSFDLPVEKGDFPHKFNTMDNMLYTGEYPHPRFYGVDQMFPKDRESFLAWHASQAGKIFDFQTEILNYCRKDVEILRLACTAFRQLVMSVTASSIKDLGGGRYDYVDGVDPYTSITISSLSLNIFRSKFLDEEKEAINHNPDDRDDDDNDQHNPHDHHNLDDHDDNVDNNEFQPPPAKKARKSRQAKKTKKLTRKQKKTERFIKSPIGVVPSGGYTHNDCFSKKSIL